MSSIPCPLGTETNSTVYTLPFYSRENAGQETDHRSPPMSRPRSWVQVPAGIESSDPVPDNVREKAMRYVTVKTVGFVAFLGFGTLGTGAGQAEAQLFGRRRVTVQETVETPSVVVAPPPVVVAPSRVKVKPR